MTFRLPSVVKATPWDERKHPRDGGKFSSGAGTSRHNPDLDAAFAAPAHPTPKPAHHDPRHNPDLDAIFGESKPHHDEHHWRPAHELLDEMDREKPKLPTALPIAQHAPPEKPKRSPFSNVRAAGRKKPGFQAPGTGKAPANLGSPAHEGEARDQLIWLLGRASRLRQQGRESGGLKPHHARQLTLAVNLASRLRHAYFNPDDAAKSKPKGFRLPYRVKAIFDEGKHPRDAGQFSSKPGASGKPKKRNTWTAADAAEMERERQRADAYFAAHRASAGPKTRTRDEHIAHLRSAISGEAKDRDISGYTLPENATEVGHQALAALHDHFQEKRAGLRIDELHKKSGTTATPEHFAAVLHKLDEAGHVRLGGYSGAIQDHPDPAHLHMMGAKVIGMVHPGDGPKPKGWQESRHRRGQPENAGQFGPGGGRTNMAKPAHVARARQQQGRRRQAAERAAKPRKPSKPGETRVREEHPASEKAARAKAAHKLVGRDIQRYSEEHNEPWLAKSLGGLSYPDSEPVDVAVPGPDGVLRHGVELKTMVDNGNFKLTMDTYAQVRKIEWERANEGATYHTVVFDDHAVYSPDGKHNDESARVYYYRRGVAGSARVGTMHRCKDFAELNRLMEMDEAELPDAARRTDGKLRVGKWQAFQDGEGKGFKNKKTGQIVRAKK